MLTFCLILCSLTSFCTCTTIEAIFSLDVCCQTWHSRYDSTPSIFFNWNKKILCYDHSNELKHIAETPPFKLFDKFQKHCDKKILPETKTTRRLSFQKPFNDCCWTCFSVLYLITLNSLQNSPAGIYLFIMNNKNTKARCETSSKLTIKNVFVFIVNFEHISYLVLVFLLLTLNM